MPPDNYREAFHFIWFQLSVNDGHSCVEYRSGPGCIVWTWWWNRNRNSYRIIGGRIYDPSSRAVAVVIPAAVAFPATVIAAVPVSVFVMAPAMSAASVIIIAAVVSSLCVGCEHGAAQEQHHQQYFFHVFRFLVQDRLAKINVVVSGGVIQRTA